jgi:hypothetical protein
MIMSRPEAGGPEDYEKTRSQPRCGLSFRRSAVVADPEK